MSLKPLTDLNDEAKCAKLGRLYVLKEARLEAVKLMRTGHTSLQSQYEHEQQDGLKMCREAVDRLEEIERLTIG